MVTGLKLIERKMWRAYFEDGSWEIVFGIIWITSGIRSLTDVVLFTWLIALGPIYMTIARVKITSPRIGHITFNQSRMNKIQKVTVGIVLSILCTVLLISRIKSGAMYYPLEYVPIMGIMLLGIFLSLAYFMDSGRFIFFGLIFFCSEIIWSNFGEPAGPLFNLTAGIITLFIGFALLNRFIKNYPIPKLEG